MMEQVTQSLAGRAGILTIYGLSSREVPRKDLGVDDIRLSKFLLKGTYPALWASPEIEPRDWFGSYVQTYFERDVRRLAQVGDLAAFERFVRACAIRTAQTLNISDLSSDTGVSQETARRWLSILQATHIVFTLQPWFTNLTSRIKKAPKLYFLHCGLAAYLMDFKEKTSILNSPQLGALFEPLVLTDVYKNLSIQGNRPEIYYLQTKSKIGADLVIPHNESG